MKIVSPFKDYYDCMQKYGQDESLTYIRSPEKFKYYQDKDFIPGTTDIKWGFGGVNYCNCDWAYFNTIVIGFCGKVYPIVEVNLTISYPYKTKYIVKTKDLDDFVVENLNKRQIEKYFNNKKPKYNYGISSGATHKNINFFFEKFKERENDFESIFIAKRCPIFVGIHSDPEHYIRGRKMPTITFNGMLNKYHFFRIVPTETAYQEIQMYLGGVLGVGNPSIPEVSNEDLIEAKGFDLKKSFRKPKQKNK